MKEDILFYDFLPYILLVAVCYLFVYFKTKDDLGLKAIFWTMLLFSAIRFEVGWDFWAYRDLIEERMTTSQFERIEWLSKVLMLMARYTFTQLYFIINTVVCMLCIYVVSKRFSKDAALSLFLFLTFSLFYLMTMNIIRNFVAILLVMFACKLFLEKKYWGFILIIFIATGFHISSLIGLIIPVIYFIVFRLKIGKWINLILFIAFFFVGNLILLIISIFSGNSLFDDIVYYIVNNTEGSGKLYQYIFYFINLVFIFSWDRLVKANEMNRLWITFVNVGVCFWVALSFQYTLSLRMALFFIVWMIILLPSFIDTFSLPYRLLVKQIVMLLFVSLFFFNLYLLASAYNDGVLDQASFLPYRTFFFQ